MHTPGRRWVKNFTALIASLEKWMGRLDHLSAKRPSWGLTSRVLAGILPAVLASMTSAKIAPLLVLMTLVLLFTAARPVYSVLFEESQTEIFCFVMTPLHLFISIWALLLLWFGRIFQISRIVGPTALALIVILWPVYSKAARERRPSLGWKYALVSILIVLQQLVFLFEKSGSQ